MRIRCRLQLNPRAASLPASNSRDLPYFEKETHIAMRRITAQAGKSQYL